MVMVNMRDVCVHEVDCLRTRLNNADHDSDSGKDGHSHIVRDRNKLKPAAMYDHHSEVTL
jgi:hypothetical protein